jgi:hypothetical protein
MRVDGPESVSTEYKGPRLVAWPESSCCKMLDGCVDMMTRPAGISQSLSSGPSYLGNEVARVAEARLYRGPKAEPDTASAERQPCQPQSPLGHKAPHSSVLCGADPLRQTIHP